MSYIRFISAMCLVAGWIASASAQSNASRKPSVTAEFQSFVSAAERACLTLANAMPEDQYAFVPTNGEFKGVRSFGLLVKHIAVDNYLNGAALLGEKPPVDPGSHENGPDSIQSKAEVMRFLRDSFAYLHRGMAKVNGKNLLEIIEYPGGGRVTRLAVISSAISHPWDIYGQMIEYLRMNGMDPQAAKPPD